MTRTVRLTDDPRCGDPLSYTEKGIVNVVPTGAAAVEISQGVKPTVANKCAASQQESIGH